MPYARSLVGLTLLAVLGASTRTAEPPKLVVLAIDLNNIHKTAPDSTLAGRIARLADALRARLATACGYEVILLEQGAEATAHLTEGYFYDHPDVAAGLALRVGADWVIIPSPESRHGLGGRPSGACGSGAGHCAGEQPHR